MTGRASRTITLVALAAVAILALAATTATAHDRGGGPGVRLGSATTSALVTDAAKRLNVTRAKLVDAIEDSARSRIDDAVADGDIRTGRRGRPEGRRGRQPAHRARPVADADGGVQPRHHDDAKLNDAFRAARKAAIRPGSRRARGRAHRQGTRGRAPKDELEDAEVPGTRAVSSPSGPASAAVRAAARGLPAGRRGAGPPLPGPTLRSPQAGLRRLSGAARMLGGTRPSRRGAPHAPPDRPHPPGAAPDPARRERDASER